MTIARKLQQVASFGDTGSGNPGGGDGTVGTYPTYPAMLPGWQMQTQQINTTADQGWTQTNGVRTIDATYNRPQNTAFGQGPDHDAMTITVTYDTSAPNDYYSSDASARFCSLPDVHVVEFYFKVSSIGNGSWLCIWERPLSGGEGEIDWNEFYGTIWAADHSNPQQYRMNAICTPYSTPLEQAPTAIKPVADQPAKHA
jgi:hypothetical protein